jgi:hypothetical protein
MDVFFENELARKEKSHDGGSLFHFDISELGFYILVDTARKSKRELDNFENSEVRSIADVEKETGTHVKNPFFALENGKRDC